MEKDRGNAFASSVNSSWYFLSPVPRIMYWAPRPTISSRLAAMRSKPFWSASLDMVAIRGVPSSWGKPKASWSALLHTALFAASPALYFAGRNSSLSGFQSS